MTQSIPAINPADGSTPEGVMNHILKQFAMQFAVRLPAVVQAYDRSQNLVTVLPSPALETALGAKINRAPLTMTALTMFGGGFFFNFPLKPGDTGHVVAFDRDISLFRQNLSPAEANTNRVHAWEDSVFIPDKFRDFTVGGEDADAVVLQSLDGATKISLKHGEINVKAAVIKCHAVDHIELNTPLCEINAALTKLSGELKVAGGITGGNGATMTGGIQNTGGDITSNGITLETHVHGGVDAGSDDTGEPK